MQKMNTSPNVSVIIPNYNHALFLDQRLRSVLDQTWRDLEVILLDDASTDNSREVFAHYASDPRVRTEFNVSNSGSPFKQWNKGVGLARGDYIWIAESDDYCHLRLLETLVPVLDANPNVGLAYCDSWALVDERPERRVGEYWATDTKDRRWVEGYIENGPVECSRYMFDHNTICNASAVVFRRKAFLDSGGAPEVMRLCGDWMTWVRILLHSDVAYVAEPLNYWRWHKHSVRSQFMYNFRSYQERYAIAAEILEHCTVSPEIREQAFTRWFVEWTKALREDGGIRLRDMLQLYRAAFRVDRCLHRRIFAAARRRPDLLPRLLAKVGQRL